MSAYSESHQGISVEMPGPSRDLTPREKVAALRTNVRDSRPSVCTVRLKAVTEAYEEGRADPPMITRAKSLDKVLSKLPIEIDDFEVLVGNMTSRPPRGAPITPEYSMEWVAEIETLDTRSADPLFLTGEDKETIRGYVSRWRGYTARDKIWAILPEDVKNVYGRLYTSSVGMDMGKGHICVDYERVLNEGLSAIRKEAQEKLAASDLVDAENIEKAQFYRAVIICCDAVISFAQRYADLARAEASRETASMDRRRELEEVAEICDRVPALPARTFHEALQSWWFVQAALFNEDPGYAFVPGRMDQYLLRFYRQDIESGRLTRDDALILIEHLYIKLNEPQIILRTAGARVYTGQPLIFNIVLGGQTRDGQDATNELSYLFLEAEEEVRLSQPDLTIRVHRDTPDDFLVRACDVARKRGGKAKFLMDDKAIESLVRCGKTLEDSRDYVLVGCMEPFVPGKSHIMLGGFLNVAKCLELALNNGVDPVTGEKIGPDSKGIEEFQTFEDVLSAYRNQVDHFIRLMVQLRNVIMKVNAQYIPVPFLSSLVGNCLEAGLDLTDGGAKYSNHGIGPTGLVNVGDALAAIKRMVFDEKRATLREIVDATRANFVGYETLLAMIEKAPKFGNDDDYVDLIVRDLVDMFCEEAEKYSDHRGAQYIASLASVTSNIPYGGICGATPDGRLAGSPLSEGGISPHQGRNVNGPTATIRSVCKVDLANAKNGSVLNMRFSPGSLDREDKLKKFAALIQAYRQLGGYLVQFNIVDSKTLREAQAHPDLFKDLTVRVATYSSLFVELSRELQDDIIARIEHESV